MWNADKLEKLLERRRLAEAGGGASRIEKQHASGKMTARERMDAMLLRAAVTVFTAPRAAWAPAGHCDKSACGLTAA